MALNENLQDERDFSDDATRIMQSKAVRNPTGWQARFLSEHGGKCPLIRASEHKKLNVIDTEKTLQRW